MAGLTRQRVFVAGATGAIGRVLCRLLVADGWNVIGTTRKPASVTLLETMGVEPMVVDVLDATALKAAVFRAQPSSLIHQLTDLPQTLDSPDFPAALARNARLREVGTKNLIDACVIAAVSCVVAQSIAFAYAPGAMPFSEDAPLDVDAADPVRQRTVRAVQTLEHLVLGGPFRGVVLRYGKLYGPGSWTTAPPAGGPVHVDAAAHAARLALLRGNGIYNIAEPDGTVSVTKAIDQLGWTPDFRS